MNFVTIIITIQVAFFFSVFKFRYFLLCPQEGHQLPLCRSVASREGEGNTVRNEP